MTTKPTTDSKSIFDFDLAIYNVESKIHDLEAERAQLDLKILEFRNESLALQEERAYANQNSINAPIEAGAPCKGHCRGR